MSDSTKSKAEAISADVFSEAYVQVWEEGGTIADLAKKLERSVDQIRAKRNSVAAQCKERGVKMPSLKRMERSGFGGKNYDKAAEIFRTALAKNGNAEVAEIEEVTTSQFEV